MTDTTELGILRAIVATPDDDTPRLVFADWLDENAQPERAEFIRVQCELAGVPEPEVKTYNPVLAQTEDERTKATCTGCRRVEGPGLCRYHTLAKRDRELLSTHWEDWHGLPALGWACLNLTCVMPERVRWDWLQFTRGFVSHVRCSAADWLAHADAIRAAHPVQEVTLSDPERYDELPRYMALVAAMTPVGEPGTMKHPEWPGITFHLSEPPLAAHTIPGAAYVAPEMEGVL